MEYQLYLCVVNIRTPERWEETGSMRASIELNYLQRACLKRHLRQIKKHIQPRFRGHLAVSYSPGAMIGEGQPWIGIIELRGPRWLRFIPRPTREYVLIINPMFDTCCADMVVEVETGAGLLGTFGKAELKKFTRETGVLVRRVTC